MHPSGLAAAKAENAINRTPPAAALAPLHRIKASFVVVVVSLLNSCRFQLVISRTLLQPAPKLAEPVARESHNRPPNVTYNAGGRRVEPVTAHHANDQVSECFRGFIAYERTFTRGPNPTNPTSSGGSRVVLLMLVLRGAFPWPPRTARRRVDSQGGSGPPGVTAVLVMVAVFAIFAKVIPST